MTVSLFSSLDSVSDLCHITVNGVSVQVPQQMTVAGALLFLGQIHTRIHPVSAEPRGAYCHMGVCFECLVEINGIGQQRACLCPVAANMVINTQVSSDGNNV